MKKNILTILLALVVGFFLGNYFLKEYNDYSGITVAKGGDILYFFEFNVYDNEKDMENNTINLENYIYMEENGKYYVYVGITKNSENVSKIKNYFDRKGYSVTVKNFVINNKTFSSILDNYDNVLMSTEDDIVISSILGQCLTKYEEVVTSGSDD